MIKLWIFACTAILFLSGCGEKPATEFEDPIETYQITATYLEYTGKGFLTETEDGNTMEFKYSLGFDMSDLHVKRGDLLCIEYEIISEINDQPCDPIFVVLDVVASDSTTKD